MVTDIGFFKPDQQTGQLGYVYHRWNPSNLWHRIGNFFIGIGPIALGSVALFSVFLILIPNGTGVWDAVKISASQAALINQAGSYIQAFIDSAANIFNAVFIASNLSNWKFWVFLYVSTSIASNISLSPADLKGAVSGIGCVIFPILLHCY